MSQERIHPRGEREWATENNKFSNTYHYTTTQTEVLKLWAEVQNAEQCCLLPQGPHQRQTQKVKESETKRRGQLDIKGCHYFSWNRAQNLGYKTPQMPFNESPGAPTIDWLGVKVIITSLQVSCHSACGFACPKDTCISHDLSFHFPNVSNLKVWLRLNNKTS